MKSGQVHRVAAALLFGVIAACSSSEGLNPTPIPSEAGAGAGGAAGASGANPGGTSGQAGSFLDASFLDTPVSDTTIVDACASVTEKATATPLNLYILLDKSSTMLGDKWDAAKQGLQQFLNDSGSAGIRVAINFFPRDPDSTPACDQPAYKEPKVPFAELPGNAQAILQALEGQSPNGTSTPIYPALGGAILKGAEILQNAPGDSAAVLLVTDGEPQGPAPSCGGVDPQDPKVLSDLAAIGLQQFKVTTFVVGLPGVNQSVANQIAAGGGSGSAIVVGTTNTQDDFQKALATVRGKALPCEFLIPSKVAGGEILFTNVNVAFTAQQGGTSETLPQDPACSDGVGWHYDNSTPPTRIILCPTTCENVKAAWNGKVDILLGCKTVVK